MIRCIESGNAWVINAQALYVSSLLDSQSAEDVYKRQDEDIPAERKPATKQTRKSYKTDYLALNEKKKSIGDLGEYIVIEFEKKKLCNVGLGKLAKQIEHTSQDEMCIRDRPMVWMVWASTAFICFAVTSVLIRIYLL